MHHVVVKRHDIVLRWPQELRLQEQQLLDTEREHHRQLEEQQGMMSQEPVSAHGIPMSHQHSSPLQQHGSAVDHRDDDLTDVIEGGDGTAEGDNVYGVGSWKLDEEERFGMEQRDEGGLNLYTGESTVGGEAQQVHACMRAQ